MASMGTFKNPSKLLTYVKSSRKFFSSSETNFPNSILPKAKIFFTLEAKSDSTVCLLTGNYEYSRCGTEVPRPHHELCPSCPIGTPTFYHPCATQNHHAPVVSCPCVIEDWDGSPQFCPQRNTQISDCDYLAILPSFWLWDAYPLTPEFEDNWTHNYNRWNWYVLMMGVLLDWGRLR